LASRPEIPLDISKWRKPGSCEVAHKLFALKNSDLFKLTKGIWLDPVSRGFEEVGKIGLSKEDLTVKAKFLQSIYRKQLKVLVASAENKDKVTRLRHAYEVNCRPSGFKVIPETMTCKSSTCPWCFIRRLYKFVFLPLKDSIIQIQNLNKARVKLVYWRRYCAAENPDNIPFFLGHRGPHVWFNSYTTAQVMVPFVSPYDDQLLFTHVGIHVVPADLVVDDTIKQKHTIKASNNFQISEYRNLKLLDSARQKSSEAINKALVQIMCQLFSSPFYSLFLPKNFEHFKAFRLDYKGNRLIRLSSTLKKEKNGR